MILFNNIIMALAVFFLASVNANKMPAGIMEKLIGKQPVSFIDLRINALSYHEQEILLKGFYDSESQYLYSSMEAYYMSTTDRVSLNIFVNEVVGVPPKNLSLCHISVLGSYTRNRESYQPQYIGKLKVEFMEFGSRASRINYTKINSHCRFYEIYGGTSIK